MRFYLILCGLAAVSMSVPALAHPGGLDASGCHNDRKRGGYHCHGGRSASPATTRRAKPKKRVTPLSLSATPTVGNQVKKPPSREGIPVSKEEADAIDAAWAAEKERMFRPKGPTPDDIIRQNRIKAIQNAFVKLGYDPGPADGIVHPKTELAIAQYKVDNDETYDLRDYDAIFDVVVMAAWQMR